jgi:PIN domain nuclease of toxin-antitoxin system
MSGVLLDTHYVFAIAGAPGRLSQAERAFLAAHAEQFSVSAVSVWEIRLKWDALFASGARKGPLSPNHVVEVLRRQRIAFLPLTAEHAIASLTPLLKHNDPFDAMLLAQAQQEGLRLLTRDEKLLKHPVALAAT